MLETVTFRDRAGTRNARGVLARPTGRARAPGLLIVHEWWGLNAHIGSLCERFADEGLLALAVDLYDAEPTADPAEAATRAQRLKTEEALDTLGAALQFLRESPGCNGKVGVTGFCLGGGLALAAAANVPGFDASVPFYGTPRDAFWRWEQVRCPVLGHFATRDGFVQPARVERIEEGLRAAGVDVAFHWYDADHAFMRVGDPSAYHAPSATLAWDRTIAFLHRHLG